MLDQLQVTFPAMTWRLYPELPVITKHAPVLVGKIAGEQARMEVLVTFTRTGWAAAAVQGVAAEAKYPPRIDSIEDAISTALEKSGKLEAARSSVYFRWSLNDGEDDDEGAHGRAPSRRSRRSS